MVREQAKQGHQVVVLTTDVQGANTRSTVRQEQHADGYTIVLVPNLSNSIAYHCKFHLAPGAISYLYQSLPDYDIVHLHEYRTTLNVVAVALRWRTKAKYILQPHGSYINQGDRQFFKRVFDFFCRRIIDGATDQVVAISQKELTQVERHFQPEQLHLIYHGISLPQARKSQVNFGQKLPQKYILFVGRLHKLKKIDFLLKSYAISGLAGRGVELIIAGNDDGELASLQTQASRLKIAEKVRFMGVVDSSEKEYLYRHALLTSYVTQDEPLGRVPLEAALCSCRSVISASSGVAELAARIDFAEVVSGKSTKELANLLSIMARRKHRVSAPAIRQLSSMTWKKQSRVLESVYRQPGSINSLVGGNLGFIHSLLPSWSRR